MRATRPKKYWECARARGGPGMAAKLRDSRHRHGAVSQSRCSISGTMPSASRPAPLPSLSLDSSRHNCSWSWDSGVPQTAGRPDPTPHLHLHVYIGRNRRPGRDRERADFLDSLKAYSWRIAPDDSSSIRLSKCGAAAHQRRLSTCTCTCTCIRTRGVCYNRIALCGLF